VADVQRVINPTFNVVNSSIITVVLVLDMTLVRWRVGIIRHGKLFRRHQDTIGYYMKRFFIVDAASLALLIL
jgi:hypothetical protein